LLNSTKGRGHVRIVELTSVTLEDAALVEYSPLTLDNTDNLGHFTTLHFDIYSKYLAIGSEAGELIVYDVNAQREVTRFTADVCGVNAVKFKTSDSLVTVGAGMRSQVKVWDVRSSPKTLSPKAVFDHLPQIDNIAFKYTCLQPHAAQEQILCGTANGTL
jgi:WD40 repeat protein